VEWVVCIAGEARGSLSYGTVGCSGREHGRSRASVDSEACTDAIGSYGGVNVNGMVS
jgi:hypothetical protein